MRKEKKKGDTRKKKKLAHFFSLSLSRSEKQQQQQNRPDKPFRLAVGSFVEDFPNRVDIVARTLALLLRFFIIFFPSYRFTLPLFLVLHNLTYLSLPCSSIQ